MGYDVVEPESSAPLPDRPCETHPIAGSKADRGDFEHLGLRLYVAAPGEQLPLRYHYHETQEEAFYVRSGTLSVETPDRTYSVEDGEVFLVEAGSPHRAFNPETAESSVTVLAVGAPTDDSGVPFEP